MGLITYKNRIGRPIPVMCNNSGQVDDVIVHSFGVECQEVFACPYEPKVPLSSESCLRNLDDDAIFSASYKAYPVKVNNQLVYNAVIQTKPLFAPAGGNAVCKDELSCSTTSSFSQAGSAFDS